MWILCLAEDSLETSSLIFSEKQWKNIYECHVLQLWLAFWGLKIFLEPKLAVIARISHKFTIVLAIPWQPEILVGKVEEIV